MNTIVQFFTEHPYLAASLSTFITQYAWSAFIGALPSPTKDSTPQYVFFFKFCNNLAGNLSRANGTRIETSPNFMDAVELEIQRRNNAAHTPVAVVSNKP